MNIITKFERPKFRPEDRKELNIIINIVSIRYGNLDNTYQIVKILISWLYQYIDCNGLL